MNAPETPPETLRQLPLFPLNNVLFPDGTLPLQIFELRYLEMISRRHAAGEPFGVVCLSRGREVRAPAADAGNGGFAAEALHPFGTLARIDELRRPQPGLMMISCTGLQRFRVLEAEQRKLGLWVADVELLPDDLAAPVPTDLGFIGTALRRLVQESQASAAADASGEAAALALREPHRWNDCGWLANRWCELLPIDGAQKQRLLALDSPVLRLELVADILGQLGIRPQST